MPYVGRTPTPSPVTADDIPDNSIDASKIVDGSIEAVEISNGSITDAKLANAKLNTAGGTLTGDVSLGDNVKATFGAGNDLQIYHDGSNSYVADAGTGDLILRGSTGIKLQSGSGALEYLSTNSSTGSVELKLSGSTKLATTSTGVDVTGRITTDGITVGDTSTSNVIGTIVSANNTSAGLDFLGDLTGTKGVRIKYEGNGNLFSVSENNSGTLTERLRISDDGDISFYEDTGTTPKFFWDASNQYLGIGTSSPSSPLHVAGWSVIESPLGSTNTWHYTLPMRIVGPGGGVTYKIAEIPATGRAGDTTSVAVMDYAINYSYASNNLSQGFCRASTRRSNNDTAWAVLEDNSDYTGNAGNTRLYWVNGVLYCDASSYDGIHCTIHISLSNHTQGLTIYDNVTV